MPRSLPLSHIRRSARPAAASGAGTVDVDAAADQLLAAVGHANAWVVAPHAVDRRRIYVVDHDIRAFGDQMIDQMTADLADSLYCDHAAVQAGGAPDMLGCRAH